MDVGIVNWFVECYFGAFLDEIFRNGGDVNEMVGDGFMVIFQYGDFWWYARVVVMMAQVIMRCAVEINVIVLYDEFIVVHFVINSGRVVVGVIKIEGTVGTWWIYTVSGPLINVAVWLAVFVDGDGVLVGVAIVERLLLGLLFEDFGELNLCNVEVFVRVFRFAVDDAVAVARIG